MAYIKSIVCGLLIVALCAAEDSQEKAGMKFPSISGFGSGSYGSMEFPNFPGFGGRPGSGGFPGFFQMPFNIPSFPSFSGFGGSGSSSTSKDSATTAASEKASTVASDSATEVASEKPTTVASVESSTMAASRKRRAADGSEGTESSTAAGQHQERQPFFGSRSLTPCNYTTEPGATCPTCSQALVCFRNNVGIVSNCAGLFKHCRNGHCSLFPSDACKESSTSSAPDTTFRAPSSTEESITTPAEPDSTTTN